MHLQKIIMNVGCQPHWLNELETDFNKCNDTLNLRHFLKNFTRTMLLEDKIVFDEFHCKKPCNFMGYRVRLKPKMTLKCIYFHRL